MARYGRRSNHWMWQPRDSRGRFGSGGNKNKKLLEDVQKAVEDNVKP